MSNIPLASVGAALACAGFLGISGTAVSATTQCPDHYQPTFVFLNPQYADDDKNGNLIVCAKMPPGNGHENSKDDRSPTVLDDIA
jgi:hypothetical protein